MTQAHNIEQFGPNKLGVAEDKQLCYYDASGDKFIFIQPPDGVKVLGYNPTSGVFEWFDGTEDTNYIYVNEVTPSETHIPDDPTPPNEVVPTSVLMTVDVTTAPIDIELGFLLGTDEPDAGALTITFGDGSPAEIANPSGSWYTFYNTFTKGYSYNVEITGAMHKMKVLSASDLAYGLNSYISNVALPKMTALKSFALVTPNLDTWDFVNSETHPNIQCLILTNNSKPSLQSLPDFTHLPKLATVYIDNLNLTSGDMDVIFTQLDSVLLTPDDTSLDSPVLPAYIGDIGNIYARGNTAPGASGIAAIANLTARGWTIHL